MDIEEGRISEQKNRLVENIQTEAKRAEKMESYWIDNMWCTVLGLTYYSHRKGRKENVKEAIFEEIIAKNFCKLRKKLKSHIQKVLQI